MLFDRFMKQRTPIWSYNINNIQKRDQYRQCYPICAYGIVAVIVVPDRGDWNIKLLFIFIFIYYYMLTYI